MEKNRRQNVIWRVSSGVRAVFYEHNASHIMLRTKHTGRVHYMCGCSENSLEIISHLISHSRPFIIAVNGVFVNWTRNFTGAQSRELPPFHILLIFLASTSNVGQNWYVIYFWVYSLVFDVFDRLISRWRIEKNERLFSATNSFEWTILCRIRALTNRSISAGNVRFLSLICNENKNTNTVPFEVRSIENQECDLCI